MLLVRSRAGVALSAQAGGIRPVSQQSAFVLGSLGYHAPSGVDGCGIHAQQLQHDLGSASHLVLRNHGLLTVGASVADAFLAMYIFEATCAIQIRAQAGGSELVPIDSSLVAAAQQQAAQVTRGMGAQLAWPGLLRRLDRRWPGYEA